MLYFRRNGKQERFQTAKVTFKVTGNVVIEYAYDFLLVFHCNYVSFAVSDVLSVLSQNLKRPYDPEHMPLRGNQ